MSSAGDALHVQAHSGAVRSLHERGLTWVSFEPMPNLACRLDFAIRKFPDLGLLSGVVQGVRHEHTCQDNGDGKDDFSFHMNWGDLASLRGAAARYAPRWRRHAAQLLGLAGYQPTKPCGPSRHPATPHVTRSTCAQYR